MSTVDRARARNDLVDWLRGLGMPARVAGVVVDHVLAAEVVGRHSHGLRLLPRVALHATSHRQEDVVVDDREPGTLTVAASGLPGIYAVERAVDEAIRMHAQGRQVVAIGVTGYGGTTGCLGLLVHRLACHGSTGIVAATSPSIMSPPGTATPVLGTNAVAIGAPVEDATPLVVDFSSSASSYGDVALARDRGEPVPEGVLLDRTGAATTDPRDVVEGSLLPSGGHRGWSQALLVEALAGAAVGGKVGRADGGDSTFVLSIGPGAFGGSPAGTLAGLVQQLREAEPGPGGTSAHVPGARYQRLADEVGLLDVEAATVDRIIRAGGPALGR